MNNVQKRILWAGLFLVLFIAWAEPIRVHNPFYVPIITSMTEMLDARRAHPVNPPDPVKNGIAIVVVLVLTGAGVLATRRRSLRRPPRGPASSSTPRSRRYRGPERRGRGRRSGRALYTSR